MKDKKELQNSESKKAKKGITIAPPEPQAPLPPTIEDAPKPREEQAP